MDFRADEFKNSFKNTCGGEEYVKRSYINIKYLNWVNCGTTILTG